MDKLDNLSDRVLELEELNEDYLGMFENSYDAMIIADGNGRALFINRAFEGIMDGKKEELLGQLIPEYTKEIIGHPSVTSKVLESGKTETIITQTSSGKQVLNTGVPVYNCNGIIHRIYINLRDITKLNALRQKYQESQILASKYHLELIEMKKRKVAGFVAHSKEINQVLEIAYRVACVDSTVLLLGESGVGKDNVAHIIHEASIRKNSGSFVKISCGAIPAELLESELFGYEGGAFTGAKREGKVGYFELADKGTLFLDEIGELPKLLQVKLLNVIQFKNIIRIGGVKEIPVDIRIIAATNRDLAEMVRLGDFREDLFYRLNVVPIMIPPLRERKEDIPFLLFHYVDRFNRKYNQEVRFSQATTDILYKYNWPGNIRELANLVERLIVTSDEPLIKPENLPEKYLAKNKNAVKTGCDFKSLREAVEEFEMQLVQKTLECSKNKEETAGKLSISLSSLTRRMRKIRQSKNGVNTDLGKNV